MTFPPPSVMHDAVPGHTARPSVAVTVPVVFPIMAPQNLATFTPLHKHPCLPNLVQRSSSTIHFRPFIIQHSLSSVLYSALCMVKSLLSALVMPLSWSGNPFCSLQVAVKMILLSLVSKEGSRTGRQIVLAYRVKPGWWTAGRANCQRPQQYFSADYYQWWT